MKCKNNYCIKYDLDEGTLEYLDKILQEKETQLNSQVKALELRLAKVKVAIDAYDRGVFSDIPSSIVTEFKITEEDFLKDYQNSHRLNNLSFDVRIYESLTT